MGIAPQPPHGDGTQSGGSGAGGLLALMRRWLGLSNGQEGQDAHGTEDAIPAGVVSVKTNGEHPSTTGSSRGPREDGTEVRSTEFEWETIHARQSALDQRLTARKRYLQQRAEILGEKRGDADAGDSASPERH